MEILLIVLNIVILMFLRGIRKNLRKLREKQDSMDERLYYIKNQITSTPPAPEKKSPETPGIPARVPSVEAKPVVTEKPAVTSVPPIPSLPTVSEPIGKAATAVTPKTALADIKPKKKSKLAESAQELLKKIWNWILVGEEFRPDGVSAEYAIASTWLMRVGIAAIVMCVAYFLMWSVQKNLISNTGRVAISIGVGIGMLVSGMKLLGKKYHVIGQGLLGGGILVLYFSVYAAGPMMYGLIKITTAFALMIFVTITAGLLSIRTNSMLTAIIGIAGGYITPVLIKSPEPNLTMLYAYILLLSLGILAIAHYKQWRLLNYLSFIFTYSLFAGSMNYYDKSLNFPVVISFLTAFFVIHSSIVYVYNILKGKHSSVLEIIHLVANAGAYSMMSYYLIEDAHGRPYPAIMSVALACFFTIHVVVFLKKQLVDRNLLLALIALAGIFTAWTLPLVFEKESLTISFSLFALMILWLGIKLDSDFMRNLAYLTYVFVFYRLLAMDMPGNFRLKPTPDLSLSAYWKEMAQRLWTFGSSIASIVTAFLIQKKNIVTQSRITVARQNDIGKGLRKNAAENIFYWIAILLIFLFLNLELNSMFFFFQPLRLPILTILWCVFIGYFLWTFVTGENSIIFNVACFLLCLVFLKIFIFDLKSWHFCESLIYNMEYSLLYAGARLIDFGAIIIMLLLAWRILSSDTTGNRRKTASMLGYGALLLFFVYTSLETNSLLYWKQPDFQEGGISVLWAIFAISFIMSGIKKNITPIRFIGLILFVIVAGKVFLLDLADMDIIYRVIAFMVLGITLLLGAFAYIRGIKRNPVKGTD